MSVLFQVECLTIENLWQSKGDPTPAARAWNSKVYAVAGWFSSMVFSIHSVITHSWALPVSSSSGNPLLELPDQAVSCAILVHAVWRGMLLSQDHRMWSTGVLLLRTGRPGNWQAGS